MAQSAVSWHDGRAVNLRRPNPAPDSRRRRTPSLPLFCLVLACAGATLPNQTWAQIEVATCGARVDQNAARVVLTKDLHCPAGSGFGIQIRADDVSLDCKGFSINGSDEDDSYGIQVEPSKDNPTLSKVSVKNCTVRGFWAGIRLSNVSGCQREATTCVLENNRFESNTQYGVQLRRQSTQIVVRENVVIDNGDEGIHISGTDETASPVCNATNGGFGNNLVSCNSIGTQHREGIYLLCSGDNEIRDNCVGAGAVADDSACPPQGDGPVSCTAQTELAANGAAGIRLNRYSKRNSLESNNLAGNAIELNESSAQNLLDANSIAGRPVRFKDGSSDNVVSRTTVTDSNTEAYDFQDSSCNLIQDSTGSARDTSDPQIQADGSATNNLFVGFQPQASGGGSTSLRCDVSAEATVRVCGPDGNLLGCPDHDDVDPSACNWTGNQTVSCP